MPKITGTLKAGSTLTVVPGAWGPNPVALTYSWVVGGVAKATTSTYPIVATDAGKTIVVKVTGKKTGYTTLTRASAATTAVPVVIGTLSPAPTPSITGTVKVGSTLTAVPGAWGPSPVALTYSWMVGGLATATTPAYKIAATDAGKSIQVKVTGIKPGYTTLAKSSASTPVVPAIVGTLTPAPTPSITGTVKVGSTLTAVSGTWGPSPVTLTYSWTVGGIAKAATPTYKIVATDVGKSILVKVTGTKPGYTTLSKNSAATAVVPAMVGTLTPVPVPTITGTLKVGSTLTAVPGTWRPSPVTLTYAWTVGGVAKATTPTYKIVAADVGKPIQVKVTGAKAGYTTVTKVSVATAVVPALAGTLTPAPVPTISGLAEAGSTLTAVPGTWGPSPVTLTYSWTVGGAAKATAATYKVVAADVGKTIAVTVTGTKPGYATLSKTSAAKTALASAFTTAPVPTIAGTAAVGSTLTAAAGTWAPVPETMSYQWKRGSVAISGATKATYTVVAADAGANVSVTTTAVLAGRVTTSKTSAATTVAGGITHVSGPITSSRVWAKGTTPLIILDDELTIPSGVTLTIEPGVIVKSNGSGISVAGSLLVNGSATNSVTFTSLSDDSVGGDATGDGDASLPSAGGWRGINVADGGTLNAGYANIRFAQDAVTVDGVRAKAVEVANSTVADSAGFGIYVTVDRSGANAGTASVKIQGNTVHSSGSYGIFVSATGTPAGSGTQIPVPTVQNNSVNGSGGTAIHVFGNKLDGALLRGNAGSENASNGISITGSLTSNTTVPLGGLPLIIDDDGPWGQDTLRVSSGVTLVVAAGQVIKSYGGGISVAGSLALNGTTNSPVTFTSMRDDSIGGDSNNDDDVTLPSAGDWGGIAVEDGASLAATFASVRYAYDAIATAGAGAKTVEVANSTVTDSAGAGIYVTLDRSGANAGTASVKIRGNTVRTSGWYGIFVSATGTPAGSGTQIPVPTVQNNTVTGSANSAIHVHGDKLDGALIRGNTGSDNAINGLSLTGNLTTNTTLPLGGLPLIVDDNGAWSHDTLRILAGATLTATAGQVIKSYGGGISVAGSLVVSGTSASPVTFTSLLDDSVGGDTNGDGDVTVPSAGDWRGLTAEDGGSVGVTFAAIRFAYDGIAAESSGAKAVEVASSSIEDNANSGIYVSVDRSGAKAGTASVKIQGNTIRDSGWFGIFVSATGTPAGSGTQIPVPTVQNNTVSGSGGTAIHIHGDKLDAALLRGNNGSGSGVNGISLTGTLTSNASLPLGGLPLIVDDDGSWSHDWLTIATGATLTVAAGQVIKSYGGGISVAGSLVVNGTTPSPVAFTSLHDDSFGGDTNGDGDVTVPAAGDWAGISVTDGGTAKLNGVVMAYAWTVLSVDSSSDAELHGRIVQSAEGLVADGYVDASNTDWGDPSGPAPTGSGASLSGTGAWIFPWVGYEPPAEALAPSLPVAATTWAPVKEHWAAFDDSCADILFIGVRGSGEEYTTVGGEWVYDGYGRMVRDVRDALAGSLPTTVDVRQYALEYPALSVPQLGNDLMLAFDSVKFGLGITKSIYMTGAAAGTQRLLAVLEDSLLRCGGSERWVLGGYSQGAMVVHEALTLVSDNSPLAGAALIADPERRPSALPVATMGSAPENDFVGALAFTRNIGLDNDLGASPIGVVNGTFVNRVIDVCDAGDPVCNGFAAVTVGQPTNARGVVVRALNNLAKHTAYGTENSTIGIQQLEYIGDNLADSYLSLDERTRTVLRAPTVRIGDAQLISIDSLDGVPADYVFSDWQIVEGPGSTGVTVDLSTDGVLAIDGRTAGTYNATVKAQSSGSLALYFTVRIKVQ